jgi:hypothetical protein
MTRTQESWLAVAKWVAGIVAAVLGSVLTFIIIDKIDSKPVSERTASPTGSSTTSPQPPWQGPLSTEQLKSALLDLKPDFKRGQPDEEASLYKCSRQDAAETVLGDIGRTGGQVGISHSRDPDPSKKDRIVTIREDLASYQRVQDAATAISRFRTWIDGCKTRATPAFLVAEVGVSKLAFYHHGDTTSAAIIFSRYTAFSLGGHLASTSQYEVVVVVQLSHTVCVLAFASMPVEEGARRPTSDDADTYVKAAVSRLMTVVT